MAFYLRKAFRAGPVRFNLSKSGISVSAGVTGARLGLSSSGRAYVHGGVAGSTTVSRMSMRAAPASRMCRLQELRAIRGGVLPRVNAETKLRCGEIWHLQSEGRLLKKRVLRSFSRNRQNYKVRGFVIDKAGTLLVNEPREVIEIEARSAQDRSSLVTEEIAG